MHPSNRNLAFGLLFALANLFYVQAQQTTLTVLGHDSFNLEKSLVAQFERESRIRLRFLKGGDAGEMLNKAILSRGAPIADVIYGFDNTLLSRALQADILQPYRSAGLAGLRPELLIDQTFRATPVDFGYVALNYDRAPFQNRPLPQSLLELATPEFARLLVVQNPATSSPGLAFLLATVATLGEQRYLDFWEELRKNGVRVVSGWSEAYYTHFTRAGGDRPLVVSYSTSPAAELYYSEAKPKPSQPPTANLFLPGSAFFQVEYVGILKGTRNLRAAQRFVDWIISKPVQESIPTQMWVYPAHREARLPEVFRFAEIPPQPARLTPQQIAQNRERWIREWTQVVIQGQSAEAVRARR
ncbi:MAG: thiamine ABC transporter substrate-binding protein [Meiothermus sp.]|uniref:thiamine ABC transporter substrate-binding protein n=1 Tax=Meiothermus sp. TaxID=1955249 RepID=UPI0025D26C78|nr:thiamine ABC transporter substrate-binding protein [Meiothermus sp.]MCS7057875.1 thiamine ABC transporter substrate-binding protein [Meiothermus sp.]MCS7194249.1 thiamine ABC transporter substrate-binding protein [Meiothermus sp.]MCX7739527.1 thiamine ABC transporter substrate-binding protein [Meiothermus sp.]MDW8090817.1 thiamine ABC transporter substrate-binding protein [Meiothermus sp.]MDW8480761.1 thiamine ABC transporter substrate-binding protein [Meiothermus sp.]